MTSYGEPCPGLSAGTRQGWGVGFPVRASVQGLLPQGSRPWGAGSRGCQVSSVVPTQGHEWS